MKKIAKTIIENSFQAATSTSIEVFYKKSAQFDAFQGNKNSEIISILVFAAIHSTPVEKSRQTRDFEDQKNGLTSPQWSWCLVLLGNSREKFFDGEGQEIIK